MTIEPTSPSTGMEAFKPGSTPEEVEARISLAFGLLVRGFSQREIVDYMVAETDWGPQLTKRQLRNYVHAARDELSRMATADLDRRELFATANLRLNAQYRKADNANSPAIAIQAVNAAISLNKLDQPQAAMNWETSAAQIGVVDPHRLRKAAERMLLIASSSPATFDRLYTFIEELHDGTRLPASITVE